MRVVITPDEAVRAGVQWRVDGGPWLDSGVTTTLLATHQAEVTFAHAPGWNVPDPVDIWVFNGFDRVTTTTFIPMTTYPIGEIPHLMAYEGQTLRFQVFSAELGSSAQLKAAAVSPAPGGPMTTDLGMSLGLFEYTPYSGDKTPFDVIFTGSEPGMPDDTQVVSFSPLPKLPLEQLAFDLQTGLSVPGDPGEDEYEIIIRTVDMPTSLSEFNTVALDVLRQVTINGAEVVFDPSPGKDYLYKKFHYKEGSRADIQEMIINADRVVIRGPLRLPGTNVTINAMELRFEDGDATATLSTTPVNYTGPAKPASQDLTWDPQTGKYGARDAEGVPILIGDPPSPVPTDDRFTEADPGADGEPAGDVRLNIGSFYAGPFFAPRFLLEGARGQDGGAALNGRHGQDIWEVSPVKGNETWSSVGDGTGDGVDDYIPDRGRITYYKITVIDGVFGGEITALAEEGGEPDKWPEYGEGSYPGGKPGDGGKGGHLYSSLNLSERMANMRGGEIGGLGGKDKVFFGGFGGQPLPSHRVELRYVKDFLGNYSLAAEDIVVTTSTHENGRNWRAFGEDWYPAFITSERAAQGAFHFEESPFSFLTPDWCRQVVNRAKEEYLFGDIQNAEERLSKYAELIDVMEAQFAEGIVYDDSQMELLALRDEMRSLLNRIASNRDFFGNPVGWVPMLSFEINKAAFSNEIDPALKSMYLAHWVREIADSLEQRQSALSQAFDQLDDEVKYLTDLYDKFVQDIPGLQTRAEQIQAESNRLRRELDKLVEKLRKKAEENLADQTKRKRILAYAQLGLRIGGSVLAAIPVGQPALGAVGGFVGMAGKFDVHNMQDSTTGLLTGSADVMATYFDKMYISRESDVGTALDDIKLDENRKILAKREATAYTLAIRTAAMAKGVSEVTATLGEFKLPMSDIEGELNRLVAKSDEFTTISAQLLDLAYEKMDLMSDLYQANLAVTIIPNQITRTLLAMNAVQRDMDENESVISAATVGFINEIERRSRERLLKYHYYMAKAYEYRLLEPYNEPLNLENVMNKIIAMAEASPDTVALSLENFESLKSIYQNELSKIAEKIFTRYNENRPELSAPLFITLSDREIKRLNAGDKVILNLVEMGFLPPWEENARFRSIGLDDGGLRIHLKGSDPGGAAAMDLDFKHAGSSQIVSGGEIYRFRHATGDDNPFIWTDRYSHSNGSVTSIAPSAALDSLLRSLLTGDQASDIMLYSRPGAWADIQISKNVFNLPAESDLVLDSVRLKVLYDFARRPEAHSQLQIMVAEGNFTSSLSRVGSNLLPYFQIGQADLNGRQDGRGGLFRVYTNQGTVTIEAQSAYGVYEFQKWTDIYGNNLAPASASDGERPIYAGGTSNTPWTDREITVNLTDHRVIRAQYAHVDYLPQALVDHWWLY